MAVAVNTDNPKSITEQATEAVRSACEESLLKGLTVTVTEGDYIIDFRFDGTKRVGKELTPLKIPAKRTIRIR